MDPQNRVSKKKNKHSQAGHTIHINKFNRVFRFLLHFINLTLGKIEIDWGLATHKETTKNETKLILLLFIQLRSAHTETTLRTLSNCTYWTFYYDCETYTHRIWGIFDSFYVFVKFFSICNSFFILFRSLLFSFSFIICIFSSSLVIIRVARKDRWTTRYTILFKDTYDFYESRRIKNDWIVWQAMEAVRAFFVVYRSKSFITNIHTTACRSKLALYSYKVGSVCVHVCGPRRTTIHALVQLWWYGTIECRVVVVCMCICVWILFGVTWFCIQ